MNVHDPIKSPEIPLYDWDDLLLEYSGRPCHPKSSIRSAPSEQLSENAHFALELNVETLQGSESNDLFIPKGAIIYVSHDNADSPADGALSIVQIDSATMVVGIYGTNENGRPRLRLPNQAYPTIDLSSCKSVVYRGKVVGWRHP